MLKRNKVYRELDWGNKRSVTGRILDRQIYLTPFRIGLGVRGPMKLLLGDGKRFIVYSGVAN